MFLFSFLRNLAICRNSSEFLALDAICRPDFQSRKKIVIFATFVSHILLRLGKTNKFVLLLASAYI